MLIHFSFTIHYQSQPRSFYNSDAYNMQNNSKFTLDLDDSPSHSKEAWPADYVKSELEFDPIDGLLKLLTPFQLFSSAHQLRATQIASVRATGCRTMATSVASWQRTVPSPKSPLSTQRIATVARVKVSVSLSHWCAKPKLISISRHVHILNL